MKKLVFAAALMLGTAAVAQDATTQPAETQAPMQETMPMQGSTPVAPGNMAPERDARGIAVVSDPAMAPSGANQPVSAPAGARIVPADNQAAVFATQQASKEYPACSKTVTDGCVQAYERGSRPR